MTENKRINFNSATVALLLCLNSITWFLPVSEGGVVLIAAVAVILYLIAGNRVPNRSVLFVICFNLLFFSPMLLGATEHQEKYLLEFIAVGIVSLSIAQSSFDNQKVFLYASVIAIVLCPLIIKMDLTYRDPGSLMGLSYGILRLICALCFLIMSDAIKKAYRLLLVIPIILYLGKYLLYASRGAILSLFIFCALLFYIRYIKNKTISLTLILISVLFVFLMFEPIIEFLSSYMSHYGIDVYAFEKILRMMDEGDVTNGRENILQKGLAMGMESPIWGHGVAAYEDRFNEGYVHNIFAQLFIEGGLLLCLPYVYYILKASTYILAPENPSNERKMMATLLSLSVVELLFSNYLWRNQVFWLFIGYTINILKNKKKYK